MATNGILIEFGVDKPMKPEDMESFKNVLGTLEAWKKEDVIEEYRYHAIVTGNRSERIGMVMLESSLEKLDQLTASKPWAELHDTFLGMCTNVTINRAITLQRMMELMSQ